MIFIKKFEKFRNQLGQSKIDQIEPSQKSDSDEYDDNKSKSNSDSNKSPSKGTRKEDTKEDEVVNVKNWNVY